MKMWCGEYLPADLVCSLWIRLNIFFWFHPRFVGRTLKRTIHTYRNRSLAPVLLFFFDMICWDIWIRFGKNYLHKTSLGSNRFYSFVACIICFRVRKMSMAIFLLINSSSVQTFKVCDDLVIYFLFLFWLTLLLVYI